MTDVLYETHVTVRCSRPGETERLRRWTETAGLKLTHIQLARGRTRSQVMVTRPGAASYEQEAQATRELWAGLQTAGFEPLRVKIESTPAAPEVPQQPGPGQYFEHHVKLRLDAGTDLSQLARLAEPHGAHVSWNARRVLADGAHERFVTQRCHDVDAPAAHAALQRLLADLDGVQIIEVEEEFVLYDSDLSLDDGWIVDEDKEETS
ncbi:hypothetical protein LWF15_01235 [Kineosporia rhizophila]|uniref:hypothetical protein n=1 Tax=Kineosporia rhizophila TaxID=84633 RepID=UPI001E28D486|nr:hypothetical protein [Kineosporia rhizophila]MCE0534126.1 hypothetical protein [Kineosporia rhizophila]